MISSGHCILSPHEVDITFYYLSLKLKMINCLLLLPISTLNEGDKYIYTGLIVNVIDSIN